MQAMLRHIAPSVERLREVATQNRVKILDLSFLAVALLCAVLLALEYDLFREEGTTSTKNQKLNVSEVLGLGALLIFGLLVFEWRRMREYKSELLRRIAAEASAHFSARHDSLTGLPNRRRFVERAEEALGRAASQGSHCAVLFVDLDGFKPVNDTFGHDVGDALLVEIADRLRSCVPNQADVARLGGDEFAALIEYGSGADEPALTARNILREIQRPIVIDGKSIKVGATIGVAIGSEKGRRALDLIRDADFAMYEGKRDRRTSPSSRRRDDPDRFLSPNGYPCIKSASDPKPTFGAQANWLR